jgi:predicted dehydrogenase
VKKEVADSLSSVSMQDSLIRVGVIGAGANTRLHHIPKLQAQDGVEIVGVCNRSRASSERVAREFGIPRVYEHWEQVIDDPAIHAIVIGTWPYMHAPITLAALEAGKHVMTEARMACNAAEAHRMLAASLAHPDLVTQIVPAPFSLRVDRTVQRLLREGFLGDLLVVEHVGTGGWLDREAPMHWRQNRAYSGLNIMMFGIVYEMLMRWVGEAVEVTANGCVFVRKRKGEDGLLHEVHVPDHLDVLATLACGALCHIQQSAVTALRSGVGTWLHGSEGMLHFYNGILSGARKGDDRMVGIEIPEEEQGGWRVEEEFVRAIRGQEKISHTTFEDGVKYMEFTEAVSRSMAEKCAVGLPLAWV